MLQDIATLTNGAARFQENRHGVRKATLEDLGKQNALLSTKIQQRLLIV